MNVFLYPWLLYQLPLACPQAVLPSMCVRQVNFFWSEQLFSKEHWVKLCVHCTLYVQSRAASHSFVFVYLCLYLWICICVSAFVYWHLCIGIRVFVYPTVCTVSGGFTQFRAKTGSLPPPLSPIASPLGHVANAPTLTNIFRQKKNFNSMWWKLFVDMTCHMASKASVPSTHADAVEHFHPRFTFSLIRWSLQIDKTLRIRVVFVDMTWQSHGHPQSTHTCGETPWTTRQIFIRFSLTLRLDDKHRKQLKGQFSITSNQF